MLMTFSRSTVSRVSIFEFFTIKTYTLLCIFFLVNHISILALMQYNFQKKEAIYLKIAPRKHFFIRFLWQTHQNHLYFVYIFCKNHYQRYVPVKNVSTSIATSTKDTKKEYSYPFFILLKGLTRALLPVLLNSIL